MLLRRVLVNKAAVAVMRSDDRLRVNGGMEAEDQACIQDRNQVFTHLSSQSELPKPSQGPTRTSFATLKSAPRESTFRSDE